MSLDRTDATRLGEALRYLLGDTLDAGPAGDEAVLGAASRAALGPRFS